MDIVYRNELLGKYKFILEALPELGVPSICSVSSPSRTIAPGTSRALHLLAPGRSSPDYNHDIASATCS